MIERERTRSFHLLLAVPVAALAGGITAAFWQFLVINTWPTDIVFADMVLAIISQTLAFSMIVLLFGIVFGLPAYFLLRCANQLTLYWAGGIGVITAGLLGFIFEWAVSQFPLVITPWAGWIGLNAAVAGYGVLWLLARTDPLATSST